MTFSLSISQQIQQLSSLQNEDQNYLPSSSSLVFVQNKNQILYHGYHKPKPLEESKVQGQAGNQQAKPKKKFVFKMGKDKDAPKTNTQLTEKLHVYSINQNRWSQMQTKGKLPSARQNQQLLMLNPNLLLMYGGRNLQNDKLLNDLHALNLQTFQWKKIFSIEGPPPTENNIIIKLTQTKIALVNFKQVWTFESKDVKWELNTNELPGGLWENLNLKFDNLVTNDKQFLLGGACISCDLAPTKLLLFSCDKQKGIVNCTMLNLNDKEISKIKINYEIHVGIENFRNYFTCFQMGLDSASDDFNQALLTVRHKNKVVFYLTQYDELSHSLKVICKNYTQLQAQQSINYKIIGKCFDIQNSFYQVSSDARNPKKKSLKKLHIKIKLNVSKVISQVQKKQHNLHSAYLSNMQTSLIQSIPEESNESSIVGMKSFPNQREEEFVEIDNQILMYQIKRTQRNKMFGFGPISEVNRSPSALLDQFESDVEETDRNNDSLVKKNEQSIQERSSFYNDSNVYNPSYKSPQQQDISNNNSSFPQQQHLQKTLEKILVYEHIKRQKLEEKNKFLQKAVQNSQTLAKLLTKYATVSQKARHIDNVKACKQGLETVWNKQVFYRRQIHQHFVPSDSQMLSRNQIPQSGKSRSKEVLNQGKIDMKKLVRKHILIEDE